MRKSKKTVFWLIGLAGFFLIVLVTLDFLIPRLINKESIREKIQDTVSQKSGAQWKLRV